MDNNCEKLVLDTSVLINCLCALQENKDKYDYIILYGVLDELDSLSKLEDKDVAKKARDAIRFLLDRENISYDYGANGNSLPVDDRVVLLAKDMRCQVATFDNVMKLKARSFGVSILDLAVDKKEEVEDYSGYKEVVLNNEELAEVYEGKSDGFDLLNNEYLIIKDKNGKVVDKLRNFEGKLISVGNKTLNSREVGTCKPLDVYQSLFIDSLMNNDVTLVKGKAGTGKTLISLTYAMQMIEKGKYDKLIVASNIISVADSGKLGYLPGTRDEKVLGSFIGGMLASKMGGTDGVNMLMNSNKLMLIPFSDIRGFDTSGTRTIFYIPEAQNLTIDLLKLGIQRVGDDCKIIVDGDYNTQVDMKIYEGKNNGMRRMSEVFRGQDFYGEVELQNIYRSRYADVADRM